MLLNIQVFTIRVRYPTYLKQLILIREQSQKSHTERPHHGNSDNVGQSNLSRYEDILHPTLLRKLKQPSSHQQLPFSNREMVQWRWLEKCKALCLNKQGRKAQGIDPHQPKIRTSKLTPTYAF